MFSKRLQLLWNSQATRVTYSKYHSFNPTRKVNLTIAYTQAIWNLNRNTVLSVSALRMQSNLSIAEKKNTEENDNDVLSENSNTPNQIGENQFLYSILQNVDKYKKTVIPLINVKDNIPNEITSEILAKDYENFTVTEILEDFKTISHHAASNKIKPDDKLHSKLFNLISKYISDIMDDQLWDMMNHIQLWFPVTQNEENQSFFNLIQVIDKSLCDRLNDFTIDQILISCDLIYRSRHPRNSKFIDRALWKIASKATKLSPENYVHYMFIFNVARKSSINMYELEYALESIIKDVTADEIGIIALAFFKTRTPIRNPALLDKIIEKCIADINHMNDISVTAVMKVVRYSSVLKSIYSFKRLLQAFTIRIDKASIPCLVHTAHGAATALIYEKDIIDKIVTRFQDIIPNARVKDLERMLYVLTTFNYPKNTPCYELIINELRNPARTEEFTKFYLALSASLMYLTNVGIYPLDIINKVMDHQYLRDIYKNNSYFIGRQYLVLETSLQIEVPEYNGPTLPPRIRDNLVKKYCSDISHDGYTDRPIPLYQKFIFDVAKHTKMLLKSDKYTIDQLLPHYKKSDIIFCVDSENNFVSPQEYMTESPMGAIKYAPKVPQGYKWIVLVLMSYNLILRDTCIPCGTMNARLRMLEKIGYMPRVLFWAQWQQLRTLEEKMNCLQNTILQNDVNNKLIKNIE